MSHLLNLLHLADEDINNYELLSFEGREAISECFDYRLELVTNIESDLSQWIGQLCEFDVTQQDQERRLFAGRIYAARRLLSSERPRIQVRVGPAFQAMGYARATHFAQDLTSIQIFDAMRTDVLGLEVDYGSSVPSAPVRGYAVRYDEAELDFLQRLFAQDGLMYFFIYDGKGGGLFNHRMIVSSSTDSYIDVASGPVDFVESGNFKEIGELARIYRAAPRRHKHVSFNINKLFLPRELEEHSSTDSWGAVYAHPQETIGYEAVEFFDVEYRQRASDNWEAQHADQVEGSSKDTSFMAGGRVEIVHAPGQFPKRLVLTSVKHSAHDPWMFGNKTPADYSNTFTAIDANKIFRAQVGIPRRIAPGPLIGTVKFDGLKNGDVKVDELARVPVLISNTTKAVSGLNDFVFLPVKQHWTHGSNGTYGSQFFPRIGTRVVIDFLYGNPDLPFISGSMYNEAQPYPYYDSNSGHSWHKSGWRTTTVGSGSIDQEFRFEDSPGDEQIYLYTGRDYTRVVDRNDSGTITGEQKIIVHETRTVTVDKKNLLESFEEIELKVGSSSITMTNKGITIKALSISIDADAALELSGATVEMKAKGPLTINGSIVKIN